MSEKWDDAYGALDMAASQYLASSHKVNKLRRKKGVDDMTMSKAMGQMMLNLYALKDAIEFTGGEWDDSDVDIALKAVKGEFNLVEDYRQKVKEEKMFEMLKTAVIYDEDENIIQTPDGDVALEAGDYRFTVVKAWHDDDGQLRVIVRFDEEGDE
jgi:hypothetical protein